MQKYFKKEFRDVNKDNNLFFEILLGFKNVYYTDRVSIHLVLK